jgi:hypothetical protein
MITHQEYIERRNQVLLDLLQEAKNDHTYSQWSTNIEVLENSDAAKEIDQLILDLIGENAGNTEMKVHRLAGTIIDTNGGGSKSYGPSVETQPNMFVMAENLAKEKMRKVVTHE